MTRSDAEKIDTIKKFNEMPWHDAKLLGCSFTRNDAHGNDVRITVSFQMKEGWSPLQVITFKDSTYIKMDVDLEGKRVCSYSIAGATCGVGTAWVKALSQDNPYDCFDDFIHFEISLISPGGSINILAKSCEI